MADVANGSAMVPMEGRHFLIHSEKCRLLDGQQTTLMKLRLRASPTRHPARMQQMSVVFTINEELNGRWVSIAMTRS